MTTLLLTGAGGFVGSHILESVLELTEWDVICVDSFRHNGVTDRIVAATNTTYGRVQILTHDLAAPVSETTLRSLRRDVNVVINAASRAQVDESIRLPGDFISNNVALTLNVLDLARRIEPRSFVHISTDEVYGPEAPRTYWDLRPSSPYAASKAAQELVCHAYWKTYDVPVILVTSANMFGERQSQLAFVPRVIKALRQHEVVRIHMVGDSPGRRHYSYVRNVTDHLVRKLRNEHDVVPRVVRALPRLTLGGQTSVDNLELALTIARFAGRTLRYEPIEASRVRPGYDAGYQPLPDDDDWKPEVPFEDALRRTVYWFLAHPEWLES